MRKGAHAQGEGVTSIRLEFGWLPLSVFSSHVTSPAQAWLGQSKAWSQ